MTEKNGCREEDNELERVLSLLRNGALHAHIDQLLKRSEHLAQVNEAQEFKQVYPWVLLKGQHWRDRRHRVEEEIALQVILCNRLEGAVVWRGYNEAQDYLEAPRYVIDPDEPEHLGLQL